MTLIGILAVLVFIFCLADAGKNKYVKKADMTLMEEMYSPSVVLSSEEKRLLDHYIRECGEGSKYVEYSIMHLMDLRSQRLIEKVTSHNHDIIMVNGFDKTLSERIANTVLAWEKAIQYQQIRQFSINNVNKINRVVQ